MRTRLLVENEETGAAHIEERMLPIPEYELGQKVGGRHQKKDGTMVEFEGLITEFNISCYILHTDEHGNIEYDWSIWYLLNDNSTVWDHEILYAYPVGED